MKNTYLTLLLFIVFKMSYSAGLVSEGDTMSQIDAMSFWQDSLNESLAPNNVIKAYKSGRKQQKIYAILLSDVAGFKNQNKESNNKINFYSCTKEKAKWIKTLLYTDSALTDFQVGERVINLVDDFTKFHDIDADLEIDPLLVFAVFGFGSSEIQGVTIFVINKNKFATIQN